MNSTPFTDPHGARLPLTGAQTGVWFAQQLAPDDPRYNTAEYLDIRGPVDPGVLAGSIGSALAEADALTAGFTEDDGQPWQTLGLAPPAEVTVADLSGEPDPAAAARAAMRADLAAPASLSAAPAQLVRDTVFRLGADRFWWYQRRHHIVLDGFGYALITRRAAEIYTARVQGAEPRPAWFGSLAAILDDEARYQASGDIAADREHWHGVLAGRAEPAGMPALSGPAGYPLRDRASLPPELAAGLAEAARRCGTSWPPVLMAALAVYLNRTAGSDDVLLAIPMMGRSGAAARVPAMVANVLPLRVPVGPRVPFAEIVQRVSRGLADMRAHQRYRGEDIRRDLGLVGPGRAWDGPLVNVIPFASALRFGPARGVPQQVAAGPSDHLSVTLHGTGSAPGDVVFDARDGHDDPAVLAAHLERFTALLSAVAAGDPDAPAGRLAILRPGERQALLPAAAAVPDSAEPGLSTIPAWFSDQARRSPHAPALTCGGETLTYAELNTRANRIAHALIARGAGPEEVVGLLLPRSADLVAAILAVLKAGAAYLPLDPAYPADRIAAMVKDADPLLVLTASGTDSDDLPGGLVPGARLDDLTGEDRDPADADRPSPLRPDNAAYIIYTSGSTGAPKGVVVSHRNAVRLLRTAGPRFGFGPSDVWTLFHSCAFDFSVWEIWGALLFGGRLVVVPHATARTPAEFWRLLRDEEVTVLNQTPEAFYSLLTAGLPDDGPRPAGDPPLRWIIFGGDALDTGRLAPWWKRYPDGGPGLVNMYGITETTVHVTRLDLDPGSASRARGTGSPVGVPLPDLRAYLLDNALQPVPDGATGEIYVSGRGVTRGYLGRPGLTAQRYIANPFGPPGDRLYRTGDLGRRLPDGSLEHLGRADRQVKVRGFRIEPAEIEAALRQHPAVARAAAVLREDSPGGPRLAAYVVRSPGTAEGDGELPRELERHLRRLLPAHMIPSAIAELDALPQGPTGKLDARLLPAVVPDAADAGRAARTPVEEIVCELAADVLAVPGAGPDDDFFALGGHSLLAAQLIWRIRAATGTELSIRDVFDHPTPAGLARRVSESATADVAERLAPAPGPRPARLPLSPAQRRLWFLQQLEGPLASYNLPLAFRLSGPVNITALEDALGDVTARHEILRTVFPDAGGEPYQLVRGPDEACPAVEITDTTEAGLDRQLAATARLGFDLAAEPPLRARLFRLAPDSHVLALTLHHIAGDEWSLAPLAADLSAAYRARIAGRAPAWRPLPVQYGDYARWQRGLLGDDSRPSALAGRQLAFWRRELDGLPDHLELPADHPRPAATSYRGGTVPVTVSAETHGRLRALARAHRATLSMVTQAAVAALLTRLGAGTDIPVGTPVAGRSDEALEDAIGFFVNTLVLRADTSGNPAFTDLLRQVRERGLAAYTHADLPFDRLVEALNPARSPGRHPLFQVMVTYRNTATAALDLPGVTAAGHTLDTGTAKFDLTVSLGPGTDGDGLDGFLEYNADLFEPATAASIAGRLTRLLDGAARTPDRPVGQLDLLAPGERDTILRDWNHTAAPVPPASLPEMITAHADRFPGREAVTDGRTRLTYGELDRRANWLASRLRDAGAGPETTVGICLDRSPAMVTALLAVLKTGAAFVPFDPSWPGSRVTGIAAGARLVAMLTAAGSGHDWPGLDVPVTEVESAVDWDPAHASADTVLVRPAPENLAYVIYTSGSTGVPKGAMIRHEAISNRLPWQAGLLGLTPGDAVLHKAPLTFDISVNEIFLPLSAGARLVLAEPGRDGDVGHLLDLIRTERVTFAYLVSTILSLMLERPDAGEAAASLRHLWCGGEVLTPELYRRFRDRLPATVMYHGYGPAEATIGVSCQVYSPAGASGADRRITIGRPNPNTRIYLLDEYLNPVTPGMPGELYLGGVPLARGYLNDPAQTASRFVADPFGPAGGRLYRTGDLGRYRADGQIEFLGRADNQVKIGGVRIEPEEVEAALGQHPGVSQATVVAARDRLGTAYLAAFYTEAEPAGTASPATAEAELLDWLRGRLPAHMTPRRCTRLSSFPLMPSGKTDRKALTALAERAERERAGRSPGQGAYVPPQGETQRQVAAVWAEIFGADRVGADDNFFDLGGHSILLVKVQTQLRARLGRDVPVLDLFSHPTVASLAEYLDRPPETEGRQALEIILPLRTGGDLPPLFCLHPAAGLSWPFAGLRQHLDGRRPLYGIQARGMARPRRPANSMKDLAAEYVDHVRQVQPHGPYHLLGWSFGGVAAHTMACQLQEAGESVAFLAMLDSYPSYPWEEFSADYEQKALRSLLYMSHYDLDGLDDRPLRLGRVLEIVRAHDGMLSSLDDQALSAVVNTFVNSAVLQQNMTHQRFDGDLLFFTAAAERREHPLSHRDWRPYVTGAIDNHDVAREHRDLGQPEALADIGPVIDVSLRALLEAPRKHGPRK